MKYLTVNYSLKKNNLSENQKDTIYFKNKFGIMKKV